MIFYFFKYIVCWFFNISELLHFFQETKTKKNRARVLSFWHFQNLCFEICLYETASICIFRASLKQKFWLRNPADF